MDIIFDSFSASSLNCFIRKTVIFEFTFFLLIMGNQQNKVKISGINSLYFAHFCDNTTCLFEARTLQKLNNCLFENGSDLHPPDAAFPGLDKGTHPPGAQ